jgi:hypothetical protein
MTQVHHEQNSFSPVCRHHWVIATPNGSKSEGYCKLCGLEREFRNSSEEMQWDSDSFSLNGSRGRGKRVNRAASLS